VSVATTVKHSAGRQFVSHVAALPGNAYDGHTLATVIPQMQALIGNVLDAASPMYNFRRLLAWLRFLWLRILIALALAAQLKLA
jgi:hypothetical protein